VLGEAVKARDALARAVALLPDDVTVLSDYAVAIVQAADKGGALPPELLRVTTEILKRKPDHPSALWFAGVARLQAGDRAGALDRWKRLRALLKPGTRQHEEITKRIEGLEKKAEP
jgi:cytochrome c-type biogenesis protein CcmH